MTAAFTGLTVYEISGRYFTHHYGGIGACCVGVSFEIFGTYKYGWYIRSVFQEIYDAHG